MSFFGLNNFFVIDFFPDLTVLLGETILCMRDF